MGFIRPLSDKRFNDELMGFVQTLMTSPPNPNGIDAPSPPKSFTI